MTSILFIAEFAVDSIEVAGGGGALGLALMLGVDGRDIGGGFGMRRY